MFIDDFPRSFLFSLVKESKQLYIGDGDDILTANGIEYLRLLFIFSYFIIVVVTCNSFFLFIWWTPVTSFLLTVIALSVKRLQYMPISYKVFFQKW